MDDILGNVNVPLTWSWRRRHGFVESRITLTVPATKLQGVYSLLNVFFLAPSASDLFLYFLYLCVPLSCHDLNSVVASFFMVLLFGSLSMSLEAVYLISFRCSISSSFSRFLLWSLSTRLLYFLLFHSRFSYLALCALFCSIVRIFCYVLCPILLHIVVRNCGRVEIDRKAILHGYITRTGPTCCNQHGFVTAAWLKPCWLYRTMA